MISNMKRVAGSTMLLGLVFMVASRPAFAQDGTSDTWFEEPSSADSQAAAPPELPVAGPDGAALPTSSSPSASPGPSPVSAPAPGAEQGPEDNSAETDPRAITEFRPTLDPYGSWVDDAKYGTVWVPNRDAVGEDFAPYVSAGHWSLSEDNDWVWQSDYPFGNVVFHYGRWVWIPGTGWSWVAGRRYANAWVTWRVPTDDYGYVGWAPMPPAWGWYGGSAVSLSWYPPAAYVFCPSGYAFSYRVHSYIVHDRYMVRDVAAHTRNYSDRERGGMQHAAAAPRVLPANSAPPRGPSLQYAHVPPSMAPASRLPIRSASAGSRLAGDAAFRNNAGLRTPTPYSGSQGVRGWSTSSYRAASANGSDPIRRPLSSAPSSTYRPPVRMSSAPSVSRYDASSAAPLRVPARSYTAPSPSYSAPQSYSAPAFRSSSATHYSAPAIHYSAPAIHYSAPATHYSAPAFNSGSAHSFHAPSRR